VVNAVVIAAADRREEFATARLIGLTRAQVVRAALWESLAVLAVGVLLGSAAATIAIAGVALGVSDIVGTAVVRVPWQLFGATLVTATVIVSVTSVVSALAATRQRPIAVAAARR
jgi:putative ABC transport system permease protein